MGGRRQTRRALGTGVQTCALPICEGDGRAAQAAASPLHRICHDAQPRTGRGSRPNKAVRVTRKMSDRLETLELLKQTVRRFVRDDLIPAEEDVEEHDRIPEPIIQQLKSLGLFGMTIPEDYGGLGLSLFEEVSVVSDVAYASPVFRSYFGTSNGVGTLGIISHGTEEQRSEEHTSELQSLMRISYAVFCLKKKK